MACRYRELLWVVKPSIPALDEFPMAQVLAYVISLQSSPNGPIDQIRSHRHRGSLTLSPVSVYSFLVGLRLLSRDGLSAMEVLLCNTCWVYILHIVVILLECMYLLLSISLKAIVCDISVYEFHECLKLLIESQVAHIKSTCTENTFYVTSRLINSPRYVDP
jgi:hypothetical protein